HDPITAADESGRDERGQSDRRPDGEGRELRARCTSICTAVGTPREEALSKLRFLLRNHPLALHNLCHRTLRCWQIKSLLCRSALPPNVRPTSRLIRLPSGKPAVRIATSPMDE